jgi:hypothetical protein
VIMPPKVELRLVRQLQDSSNSSGGNNAQL